MLRGFLLLVVTPLLVISVAGNLLLLRQGQSTSEEAAHLRQRAIQAEQALNSQTTALQSQAGSSPPGVPAPSPTMSAPSAPLAGPGLVQDVLTEVQTLRGLRSNASVPVKFLEESALKAILMRRFEQDYLPTEREVDQKLLVMLGLLRPDQDLVGIDRDLLTDQVLGLYSTDDKTLYVLGDASQIGPAEEATIAGAYIHALQDQAYDLSRITPMHTDNNDRAAAIQALIEGDAVLTQSLWSQTYLSAVQQHELAPDQDSLAKLQQAPPVVRTNALFPYVDGMGFVVQLYKQKGFAGVDAAFNNLPVSTAQILHPEMYLAGVQPIEVAAPDLADQLGAPWRRLDTNVLGELGIRNVLAQYGDRQAAQAAASGWRGDRWQLLERDGQLALVLRTIWASDAQASRFFLMFGQGLKARFPDARPEEQSASRQALTTSGVATDLRRRGSEVDAIISFDRDSANALASLNTRSP
jgi:hypothetical protein